MRTAVWLVVSSVLQWAGYLKDHAMNKQAAVKAAPKVEAITDFKKLDAHISATQKAHQKVDGAWQVAAFSAITAFAEHGNVFYINKVYGALGKGARHKAMTEYFLAFGGVKANDGENKKQTPFIKDADKKPNLAEASVTMWYDMAPSKAPDEVVDYLALIMKVANRSPKEGQSVAHDDFRAQVLALAQAYSAEDEEADTLAGVADKS